MNKEDKRLIKFVLTAPPGKFAEWLYANPQGVNYAVTLLSNATPQELSGLMDEMYEDYQNHSYVAEATSEEDPEIEAVLEKGYFQDAKSVLQQFTLNPKAL